MHKIPLWTTCLLCVSCELFWGAHKKALPPPPPPPEYCIQQFGDRSPRSAGSWEAPGVGDLLYWPDLPGSRLRQVPRVATPPSMVLDDLWRPLRGSMLVNGRDIPEYDASPSPPSLPSPDTYADVLDNMNRAGSSALGVRWRCEIDGSNMEFQVDLSRKEKKSSQKLRYYPCVLVKEAARLGGWLPVLQAELQTALEEVCGLYSDTRQNNVSCAICQEWLGKLAPVWSPKACEGFIPHKMILLECGHLYCEACITSWLAISRRGVAGATCPMCKAVLDAGAIQSTVDTPLYPGSTVCGNTQAICFPVMQKEMVGYKPEVF